MRWAVILSSVAAALGATATDRARSSVSHQRFPLEMNVPISNDLQLLEGPKNDLRAPPSGVAFAFPGDGMLRAIPMASPQDNIELVGLPGALAVDGPLRDLLDFGSAFGAAVLPRRDQNGPLAVPMNALHVQMQQKVPTPLSIDDTPSQIRIFGTLPKNLNEKMLKVFLRGHNIDVKYFVGDSKQASNSVVGIDERFKLDFEPTSEPSVRYKAETGSFQLSLPRPPKSQTADHQVNIEFDNAPRAVTVARKQPMDDAIKLPAKPTRHNLAPPERKFLHKAAPAHGSAPEVGSVKLSKATKAALKHIEKLKPFHARKSSPEHLSSKQFIHKSTLARRSASKAHADLAKATKQVREASKRYEGARDSAAVRAKAIAQKAKSVVADAHMSDVKTALDDAFAPTIFEDEGLVLLELNH